MSNIKLIFPKTKIRELKIESQKIELTIEAYNNNGKYAGMFTFNTEITQDKENDYFSDNLIDMIDDVFNTIIKELSENGEIDFTKTV